MTDIPHSKPAAVTNGAAARLARADRQRRWIARTQFPLNVLAFIFLGDMILLWCLPDADGAFKFVLDAIVWVVWAAFAVDYLARLMMAPGKGDFVRTHKLDLLMVLVPMLRLLRVALLLRRSLASVSTEKIAGSIASIVVVVIIGAAFLEWQVEHLAPGATITTFRQGIWWAIVTTTTVGYGDYTPVTPVGRLIATGVMMVGVGLIGTISATIASWFVTRRNATGAAAEDAAAPVGGESSRGVTVATGEILLARLESLAAEQTEIRRLLETITPA